MCTNIDEPSSSKRKALELITNIFRKKSKDCLKGWTESENHPPIPSIGTPISNSNLNVANNLTHHQSFALSDNLSDYGIPPHSPVSPRVKNIDEDMEQLTLSRQDNPFIVSKLEKLSSSSDDLLLSPLSSSLTIQQDSNDCYNQQLQSPSINCNNMDIDDLPFADDSNLHQHLIRSPPPQFPTKLSHFIFPLPNSPIKSISTRYGSFIKSPDRRSESRSDYNQPTNLQSTSFVPAPSTGKPLEYNSNRSTYYQSTNSVAVLSPSMLTNNCLRKNSIGADRLTNKQFSSSTTTSTAAVTLISNLEVQGARRASSGSFAHDLGKLSFKSSINCNDYLITGSKSSSNLTSNKDNVIDYLKGRLTSNASKNGEPDERQLQSTSDADSNVNGANCPPNGDNNANNWNQFENNLSNSREALISAQSSLLDVVN